MSLNITHSGIASSYGKDRKHGWSQKYRKHKKQQRWIFLLLFFFLNFCTFQMDLDGITILHYNHLGLHYFPSFLINTKLDCYIILKFQSVGGLIRVICTDEVSEFTN